MVQTKTSHLGKVSYAIILLGWRNDTAHGIILYPKPILINALLRTMQQEEDCLQTTNIAQNIACFVAIMEWDERDGSLCQWRRIVQSHKNMWVLQ